MKYKFSKWHILVGFLLILVFTNPSNSDFKNYLQGKTNTNHEIKCGKTFDGLIFSIHKGSFNDENYTCLGVLNNFIVIEYEDNRASWQR
jgi:hypothetical protein